MELARVWLQEGMIAKVRQAREVRIFSITMCSERVDTRPPSEGAAQVLYMLAIGIEGVSISMPGVIGAVAAADRPLATCLSNLAPHCDHGDQAAQRSDIDFQNLPVTGLAGPPCRVCQALRSIVHEDLLFSSHRSVSPRSCGST
jgi:hypothetical protein